MKKAMLFAMVLVGMWGFVTPVWAGDHWGSLLEKR